MAFNQEANDGEALVSALENGRRMIEEPTEIEYRVRRSVLEKKGRTHSFALRACIWTGAFPFCRYKNWAVYGPFAA